MVQTSGKLNRGTASSLQWAALCKDCRRNYRDKAAPNFNYPDAWIETVINKGGTRSDRCPVCRREHARDAKTFAAPYVDLDVIGRVENPLAPDGPLGGLGPLPIEHERSEIVSNLNDYDFGLRDDDITQLLVGLTDKRVAVVTAGTGTGKSTFLPYRLLIPPDDAPIKIAEMGPIVVTEPRRAAAIDTATFVATKLHKSHVGAGSDVGYRVQNGPAYDASCRLLYVTDGSLINWLRDGSYKRFGAVIVDEAHERSKNIDLILGLLRDALPKVPHLKVIIASATIDPKFFIDYFGGDEHVYYLDAPAPKNWGYGAPLWPGIPVDLDHKDWKKPGPNGEDLISVTEKLGRLRILNEPLDPGGRAGNWTAKMPGLVAEQVIAIAKGTSEGDILAFLPGKDAIETAIEQIKKQGLPNFDVYPLLRNSPPHIQLAARGEKADSTRRRIVVSTNIAETSLTIDGISYVVDSGLIRQTQWNANTASKFIPIVVHSRDGVKQRWGRVGRKAPGWVFPLYSKEQYENESIFPPHTPPESVRDDLEQFFLTAKSAGVDNPNEFVWPAAFVRTEEKPSNEQKGFFQELARSEMALKLSGLVDADGDVTPLGKEVQVFNTSIFQARSIVLGDSLACATEVATALVLLNGPKLLGNLLDFDPEWPILKRNHVRRIHEAIMSGCSDDLDVVLRVFALWESSEDREAWSKEHYVDHAKLKKALEARRLLLEPLSPARKSDRIRAIAVELAPRVRQVFSRTLIDQTFQLVSSAWVPLMGHEGKMTWVLDPQTRYSGSETIIAFRRASSRIGIWLSNVVNAVPTDAGANWLDIALKHSNDGRDAQGRLLGASVDAQRQLLNQWKIGTRYRAKIRQHPLGITVSQVSVMPHLNLSLANQIPLLASTEQNEDSEEETLEEQEVDAYSAKKDTSELESDSPDSYDVNENETNPGEAVIEPPDSEEKSPDPQDEISSTDIVSLTSEGVIDESQEPQFVAVADLESDQWNLPDNLEYQYSSGSAHGSGARVTTVITPIDLPWPQNAKGIHVLGVNSQPNGENLVQAVPIAREIAGTNLAPLKSIEVTLIESVREWGPPYIVGFDAITGVEVMLPAQTLSFNPQPDAVDSIPVGTNIDVTLIQFDNEYHSILGSYLETLYGHLLKQPSKVKDDKTLYLARVASIDQRGGVVVVIGQDEPTTLVQTFIAPRSVFAKNKIKPEIGDAYLVELQVPKVKFADGLPRVAAPKKLRPISQKTKNMLKWAKKNKSVACEPRLSPTTRDQLIQQSSDPLWAKLMYELWMTSNQLEVVSVHPTDESKDELLTKLRKEFPRGAVVNGKVSGISDALGVFVTLESHEQGLLHVSKIGQQGVFKPSMYFQIGQEVQASIAGEVKLDEQGKPRISLKYDGPIPSLWDQLSVLYPMGHVSTATVASVDKIHGVSFDLEHGLLAQISNGDIGPSGVLDPTLYFKPGDSHHITLKNLVPQPGRRPQIVAEMTDASVPEILDQLRERFRVDMPINVKVTQVKNAVGAYVVTDDRVLGLIPKLKIGPEGAIKPSDYLKIGQEVIAFVDSVAVTKDNEPRLSLRLPEADVPPLNDQARSLVEIGTKLSATITKVQDNLGLFLHMNVGDGLIALAHKRNIGQEGVVQPSSYFAPQQKIQIEIRHIEADASGRLKVDARIDDTRIPSRETQLRELYGQGNAEFDAVVDTFLKDQGVFVKLVDTGEKVLVFKDKIGLNDKTDIKQILAIGDRIRVSIVSIRKLKDGSIGLAGQIHVLPPRPL